jgi:hypothetical protein
MDAALYRTPSEHDDQPRDSVPSAAEREAARVEGIKDATLGDMAEMRAIGMRFARRLDKRSAGEMSAEEEKGMRRVGDDCVAFERTTRAVRQIIALEHETVGIRPMPRYGEGGSHNGGSDRRGGGGEGRERLRTGSTRGYRSDLKDRPDRDREKQELLKEADAAFGEQITRIDKAAGLDLEAGGMGAEAAKSSPHTRITRMIYEVPRPNFEACLEAMAREPRDSWTSAWVRKNAAPGTYKPPPHRRVTDGPP